MTPREACERSLASAGERQNRIVTLTRDFLILTCPTVSRGGRRKADRQRGLKVHNHFYYWCPELRDPKVQGKYLPVRYDPWDASTVYVQINKRWVAAHCKALVGHEQMTEKERELISDELCGRVRLKKDEEPSPQKLKEFLRIFTPEGALGLSFERQQENRELYEHIGLGAITPSNQRSLFGPQASATTIDINSAPVPRQPESVPVRALDAPDDLEFETF